MKYNLPALRAALVICLKVLMSGPVSFGQSDVAIGGSYKMNLQRQTDNADAYILHNAKVDASSTQIMRWETSHGSFGSRGIQFQFYSGIHFFADGVASTAGSAFSPTTRFFIGNDGKIGVGTISPSALVDLKSNSATQLALSTGRGAANARSWLLSTNLEAEGDFAIRLSTTNSNSPSLTRMLIDVNGNLGVGTSTPTAKLHVAGHAYFDTNQVQFYSTGGGGNNYLQSVGGQWMFKSNYDHITLDAGVNAGNERSIQFRIAGQDKMIVDTNGNVGIGTSNPDAKLAVKGTIHTQEVKVDMNNWSDYVFYPNYQLRPLAEVQQYIEENHHLPDVPSEKEVLANGQNLGEMNAILLKKIEELTLYVIELKRQLDAVEQKQK